MQSPAPAQSPQIIYRRLAASVIVLAACMRLAYLAWLTPLDLAPDEAHYWDWSRHLDWSYYSKGPLVALLIRGSCALFGPLSVALTGTEMLAVRLPSVVCGALLLTSLYILTSRILRSEKQAFLAVLVALSVPVVAAGSSLMTIDAPFTCLWSWALVAAHSAVFRGGRSSWAFAGVLVALGILAKPTMILWLPCFTLFLLFTPTVRALLFRPGFWLLMFIALLGAAPIVWWNAQNGWVTLRHTRGHAGLTSRQLIHWFGPFVYFGTQFALLLGYWFSAWAASAVRFHPLREARAEYRYLWWMSVPVIVFFALFSFKNGGGEPNWPLAGYISGAVLLTAWLAEWLRTSRPFGRCVGIGIAVLFVLIGVTASVLIHDPVRFQPIFALLAREPKPERPMPLRQIDPTCRLRGWRTLAREVDVERQKLAAGGEDPVIAGTHWTFPGELGFYCQGHPTVYCLGPALGDRHSQYDLWRPNPLADAASFHGRTFIIVGAYPPALAPAFDRVDSIRVVEHREGNHLISTWTLAVGHGYRGFLSTAKTRGW